MANPNPWQCGLLNRLEPTVLIERPEGVKDLDLLKSMEAFEADIRAYPNPEGGGPLVTGAAAPPPPAASPRRGSSTPRPARARSRAPSGRRLRRARAAGGLGGQRGGQAGGGAGGRRRRTVDEDRGDEEAAHHLQPVGALLERVLRVRAAGQQLVRLLVVDDELLVREEDEQPAHDRRRLEHELPVRLLLFEQMLSGGFDHVSVILYKP